MDISRQCINASRKALEWASSRIGGDGSIAGSEEILFGYYKGPLAFAAGGFQLEAARLSRKLRSAFYKDGAFALGEPYPAATVGPTYLDSWLTWGMHSIGDYDLSVPAGRRIEAQLDGATGAAYTDLPARPGDEVDLGITCVAMATLLALGRLDVAVRGGKFVLSLIEQQAESTDRISFRWKEGSGLVSPKPGALGWTISFADSGQVYWYLGFALILFAQLYAATQDKRWLDGANKVYRLIERCNPEIYQCVSNGKIAWGAAEVFRVSGDPKFAALSERIASWICSVQQPEGIWLRKPGPQEVPVSCDATFERSYYLHRVARSLQ